MKNLPYKIIDKAYISSSNELAWKIDDLENAIDCIINEGYEIDGIDIGIITNDGGYTEPPIGYSLDFSKTNLEDYRTRVKKEIFDWIKHSNDFLRKNEFYNNLLANKKELYYLLTF